MLERILKGLRQSPHAGPGEDKRLAAAVLLLETARADYAHHELELDAVREGLAREFGVAPEALAPLLADAEQRAKHSVSLHEFVQTLNRALDVEEKRSLLRLLWQVAYADGKIEPLEEHLLRRLADLLHLPHADFIRAKLAASDHSP